MFRNNKILLASRLCNHNTNLHRFPPGWSLMYYVLVRIDRARFGLAIHLIYLLISSTGFGRECPCQGSIWGGGRVDSGLCHFLILLNFADFCHFSTKIRQHHEKLTFFAEKGQFFLKIFDVWSPPAPPHPLVAVTPPPIDPWSLYILLREKHTGVVQAGPFIWSCNESERWLRKKDVSV